MKLLESPLLQARVSEEKKNWAAPKLLFLFSYLASFHPSPPTNPDINSRRRQNGCLVRDYSSLNPDAGTGRRRRRRSNVIFGVCVVLCRFVVFLFAVVDCSPPPGLPLARGTQGGRTDVDLPARSLPGASLNFSGLKHSLRIERWYASCLPGVLGMKELHVSSLLNSLLRLARTVAGILPSCLVPAIFKNS